MRHTTPRLTLAGIAALLLVACGGGGGSGSSSSGGGSNAAPVANAGLVQTVNAGAAVTLNGTGSTDSDGTVATYTWTQTAGTTVALSSPTVSQPTFTAPNVVAATTLTFTLVVTDNRGAVSAAATVNVTVNPLANVAPTANAGTAQTVTSGTVVTLNGTASTDSDGTIASYAWTQTVGTPVVALTGGTTSQPTFTAPTVAVSTALTFSLVVTDNRGGTSAASTVIITVNPAANVAPTANAGPNQTFGSGVTVTLNGTASSDPGGSIASYAWTQTVGAAVTLSSNTASQPTFTAPTVATATTLTFSLVVTDNLGAASAADTVDITINPPVVGNVNVTGNVTFGRVPFASSGNLGLNYAAPIQQPLRSVVVRALDANTPMLVHATGITTSLGNYSLSVPGNANVTIQVVARLLSTTAPTWDVSIQNGDTVGLDPYSYTDTAFNVGAGTTHNVAIPTGISASGVATATSPRASGPFAVLDTIYKGIQTVLAVAPTTNFPALLVDWGSQNSGTFFSSGTPQHIALLSALNSDTDEFDQHVIAHEFGHYIEFNFSRADNIGGSHGVGDKLDPRVAFGEGFGYAFAGIVLNDPVARDSFVDSSPFTVCGVAHCAGGFNIETNPPSTGAVRTNYGCWCSESSVWSILWDIYDSAADTNDNVALGFQPIWDVLTGPQRNTPAFTTIFSFITSLKAQNAGSAAAVDTLVAAQNVTSATIDAYGTNEAHWPLEVPEIAALPVYGTATIGGPAVVLRTVDDAELPSDPDDGYNKLGDRRFVRFALATTQTITITASSSNTNTPDTDFFVYRNGAFVNAAIAGPAPSETLTLTNAAAGDYLIDVYDCANGCAQPEGTSGDYNLTVTIN
jgi:hypothetical protein